jgi:transposase InsO family protein
MCQVLGVSRSGFYKWDKHPPSQRRQKRDALLLAIRKVYTEHKGRLGSPKIKRELDSLGIKAGKNLIASQMRLNGLKAITHKKFRVVTTDSNHSLPVAENLLNREFMVAEPDRALVSDITYIKTNAGWVYLTVFIDLFSRLVVSWAISTSLSTEMVLNALHRAAFKRKLLPGAMIHSDRGSQYASDAFRSALKQYGFVQSMSRKGNCWDNAVAESFFRIYKSEFAYHCHFENEQDVFQKTFEYIECYYNRKRRHGSIGYLTPAYFDKQWKKAA